MDAIHNDKELEFAIFCIENISIALGKEAEAVYDTAFGAGTKMV